MTDYDPLRPITDAYGQLAEDEEKIMLYLLKNKTIDRKETVEILNYGETKIKELFNNMIYSSKLKKLVFYNWNFPCIMELGADK